jgi:hypothetical protein
MKQKQKKEKRRNINQEVKDQTNPPTTMPRTATVTTLPTLNTPE